MPKFDIPVIVQVEAEDIDAARVVAYGILDRMSDPKDNLVALSIANDECVIKDGRRIVFLHPADADADYDPEAYNANKEDK